MQGPIDLFGPGHFFTHNIAEALFMAFEINHLRSMPLE